MQFFRNVNLMKYGIFYTVLICYCLSERTTVEKLRRSRLPRAETLKSCLPLATVLPGVSTVQPLRPDWPPKETDSLSARPLIFFSSSQAKCRVGTKSCKDPQNTPSYPFIPKWAPTRAAFLENFLAFFSWKIFRKEISQLASVIQSAVLQSLLSLWSSFFTKNHGKL